MTRNQRELIDQLLGRSIPILAYHSISPDLADELTVSPGAFRDQMRWLADSGWKVISLDEGLRSLSQRRPLSRSVVLTFDDGYRDFLDNAAPTLDAAEFVATIFVVTAKLGQKSDWNHSTLARETMSLADLKGLSSWRYVLGSHSSTHARLTDLDAPGLEAELRGSLEDLQEISGRGDLTFAYPFGALGDREIDAVRQAGYQAACAIGGFWGNGVGTDRFTLRRYVVPRRWSITDFRRVVASPLKLPLLRRAGQFGDA